MPEVGPLTGTSLRSILLAMAVIGGTVFIFALIKDSQRAWYSYLINFFYFLCLGLAGLFFTALQHATHSTWSVCLRRIAEGFYAYLPVALVLLIPLLIGAGQLYNWHVPVVDSEHSTVILTHAVDTHSAAPDKKEFLNLPLFTLRLAAAFLVWLTFGYFLLKNSLKQDQTKEIGLSRKNSKLSVAFLPLFAFTFSFACFDLIMSIEPNWYSTMFGVYCFAGLFQAGLAFLIILIIRMRRVGILENIVNRHHYKDLGGLLFAFSVFMAYIGFSQFMLIWYANLPEETVYFLKRFDGNWLWVAASLPFLKFFIPFFGLLSQAAKRSERRLLIIAGVVLIGEWVDLYWMIAPNFSPEPTAFLWTELGLAVGFAGLFGLSLNWFFRRHSMLASGDPRVSASLDWQG